MVKASCAPRDQGSNSLVRIVGWLYTRSGAIVASGERLLDPVTCCWRGNSGGWLGDDFRRYWDRSNIPQRKRRMKCGMMGNWRCSDDRAKCPYLRTHSVGLNALFRRVE